MTDNVSDIADYGESGLESDGPNVHSVPGTPGGDARDDTTAADVFAPMPDTLMDDATQAASAALESTHPLIATADTTVAPVIPPGSTQLGIPVERGGAPDPVDKQHLDSRDASSFASSGSGRESNAVPIPAVSTRAKKARARSANSGFEAAASGSQPQDAPPLIRVAMADALPNGTLAPW